MRNVIAPVEVVIDIDLPVAVERVDAAIKVMEFFGELRRRDERGDPAQKLVERRGFAVEIDEDEVLPGGHANGNEAVVFAVKIAHALQFDHAFEGAIVAVGPAMIGAAELFGGAALARLHGGGMVAADVEESAQLAVVRACDSGRRFIY